MMSNSLVVSSYLEVGVISIFVHVCRYYIANLSKSINEQHTASIKSLVAIGMELFRVSLIAF